MLGKLEKKEERNKEPKLNCLRLLSSESLIANYIITSFLLIHTLTLPILQKAEAVFFHLMYSVSK